MMTVPSFWVMSSEAPARNHSLTSIVGGLFLAQTEIKTVLDKSDFPGIRQSPGSPGFWFSGNIAT
jgi:hypothetical protein